MLRVNEIFLSIDGECNKWGQGVPSLFIRLQGCNANPPCPYCDTPKSLDPAGGTTMTIQEIKQRWLDIPCPRPKVTITGGEPLLQEEGLHQLLNELFPYQARISIETNGTLPLDRFRNIKKPDSNINLIVDWKLNLGQSMAQENFLLLLDTDWVKFVVRDHEWFREAVHVTRLLRGMGCKARMALSPAMGAGSFNGSMLWQWMVEAEVFDMTLNVQIHKLMGLA